MGAIISPIDVKGEAGTTSERWTPSIFILVLGLKGYKAMKEINSLPKKLVPRD